MKAKSVFKRFLQIVMIVVLLVPAWVGNTAPVRASATNSRQFANNLNSLQVKQTVAPVTSEPADTKANQQDQAGQAMQNLPRQFSGKSIDLNDRAMSTDLGVNWANLAYDPSTGGYMLNITKNGPDGKGINYWNDTIKSNNNSNTGSDNIKYNPDRVWPWQSSDLKDVITSVNITCDLSVSDPSFESNSYSADNPNSLEYLFGGLSNLRSIRSLNKLSISGVTSIKALFYGDEHLSNLSGIEGWDTSTVKDMSSLFQSVNLVSQVAECQINLSGWNTDSVENMSSMFSGTEATLSGISQLNVSKVANMNSMFAHYQNPPSSQGEDLDLDFDFSHWSTDQLQDTGFMFYDCPVSTLKLFDNNLPSAPAGLSTSKVIDMSDMFAHATKLQNPVSDNDGVSYDFFNLDTGSAQNMDSMFDGDTNIKGAVQVGSNFEVSNVKDMRDMFARCSGITKIDGISSWVTSNVTNMAGMFSGCEKLADIPQLDTWNIAKVKDMSYMFSQLSLESISVPSWNVSNVQNMSSMFDSCTKLKDLDLSKWQWGTYNSLVSVADMFADCSKLQSIDLGKMDTSGIHAAPVNSEVNGGFSMMFSGSNNIQKITMDKDSTFADVGNHVAAGDIMSVDLPKLNDGDRKDKVIGGAIDNSDNFATDYLSTGTGWAVVGDGTDRQPKGSFSNGAVLGNGLDVLTDNRTARTTYVWKSHPATISFSNVPEFDFDNGGRMIAGLDTTDVPTVPVPRDATNKQLVIEDDRKIPYDYDNGGGWKVSYQFTPFAKADGGSDSTFTPQISLNGNMTPSLTGIIGTSNEGFTSNVDNTTWSADIPFKMTLKQSIDDQNHPISGKYTSTLTYTISQGIQ